MQWHEGLCTIIRCKAIPCNTIRCHAIQCTICIFGPKKGHFRQLGPYNGLPSSQTATFRKTEVIQCYLRICGCYDLIKSGSSEPKKKGFYGCSVKKSDFRAIFVPKMASCSPPWSSLSNMSDTKTLSFWCLVMMVTKKLEDVDKKLISGQKTHFWAQKGPLWAIGAKKRPAGKPKVSRVTSGYGGHVVSPVRCVWAKKMGVS